MPKHVDHEQRRRELADAVCRVIAREGVETVSLRLVAVEAGWSIGSMRYYFATKAELLAFALRHVADRIAERLARRALAGRPLERLRAVLAELLPLDGERREEHLVWLAFVARASVDSSLAGQAQDVWNQVHGPLVELLRQAVSARDLPAELDPDHEATRLQALVDGLAVQLVAAPDGVTPAAATAIVQEAMTALGGGPPASRANVD
jgi:AcrR family transcriptional regulator